MMRHIHNAFAVAAAAFTAIGFSLALPTLEAQSPSSTREGVYSVPQADRGAAIYAKACASCHGAKFEGRNQAPPLTGQEFVTNWNGQTLGDLFEKIQTSMPADKPGSLKSQESADLIGRLLRENGMPSSERELSSDTKQLEQIKFEAAKAK